MPHHKIKLHTILRKLLVHFLFCPFSLLSYVSTALQSEVFREIWKLGVGLNVAQLILEVQRRGFRVTSDGAMAALVHTLKLAGLAAAPNTVINIKH